MGVERIEPGNYKQGVSRMRGATCVVLVFHPQCGHCVEMRPKWEAMKSMVQPHVKIVEINGEGMHGSPEMSRSPVGQNTEGFPSILRLEKGRVVERFEGERTPEKMAAFANKARAKGKAKSRGRSRRSRPKTKKLRRKN